MRVFYDTEFIERGPRYPIKLISIGMVREDGVEYYAVNGDLRSSELRALHEDDWLRENVLAHLPCKTEPLEGLGFGLDDAHPDVKSMNRIALDVDAFCDVDLGEGEKAELWAYYADYDHVVLSQLFGRMVDLPAHMPMYTRDLKQFMDDVEVSHGPVNWKQQTGDEHHALADAKWVAKTYAGVEALSRMTVKP